MNNETSMIKQRFVHYDRFEFIVYCILLPLHEFRSLTLLQEWSLQDVVIKHEVRIGQTTEPAKRMQTLLRTMFT